MRTSSTSRPSPCFFPSLLLIAPLVLLMAPASAGNSEPAARLREHTGVSGFRVLNRRSLRECVLRSPLLAINVSAAALGDEENVTVTVSGVFEPDRLDWVGMISPSDSDVSTCLLNSLMYKQTGDLTDLPLLCHYPVKAQPLHTDPSYLGCGKRECRRRVGRVCLERTCSGSVTFHVVNFRTDVEFVFFSGGFEAPCILKRSAPVRFANPNRPLHGHLASVDSAANSMRVTWVSGDRRPQQVQYGGGKRQTSTVTTFTRDDMRTSKLLQSPAVDFGWHDPGFIHSAVMTGLEPSKSYSYKYGSDGVGWSNEIKFKTPPAAGADELRFLAFGDMGKAPLDLSTEHYIQPGSLSVVKAITDEVASGSIDSVFHIGDISYATGFLVEWDYFLKLIEPVASQVPYMTAIGNHERDYEDSGSVYLTPDSGGECGVPYETYFPMPTAGKDKPWYSIEQASVHFTVISTEHPWHNTSEQYNWIRKDLESVDRTRTPWLIFAGHRPMYTSMKGIQPSVDPAFVRAVEPLLMRNKVDLALFGHVHNYERTCAVFENECKAMPVKDEGGIDTYDSRNYTAPVHAIIGMAGFSLDKFQGLGTSEHWSISKISEYGYARVHATKENLTVEMVNSNTRQVRDRFRITKANV